MTDKNIEFEVSTDEDPLVVTITRKNNPYTATVDFDDANVDFTDSEYALALHKAIIERKVDDKYLDTTDTPHTYVRIFYYLNEKGEEVFSREYFVDKTKLKKESPRNLLKDVPLISTHTRVFDSKFNALCTTVRKYNMLQE